MLIRIALALVAGAAFAQTTNTTFTITPALVTQCNSAGQGTVQLSWRTAESSVQVRIGSSTGPAMTGFQAGNGGATSGDWVSDGMVFVLVNPSGQELARATASVQCRPASSNLADQLATQSYLPLEVGNRWIYRYTDRSVTANHLVRTVDRTVVEAGETWYVLRDQIVPGARIAENLYRTDADGRIYWRRNSISQLFLDPTANPDPNALAIIQQRNVAVNTPFGSLSHTLSYTAGISPLLLQRGTYSRGVGLISLQNSQQTGSSGGLLDSIELVEAVIAGKLRFTSPSNGLELSPESQLLDLVGRKVRNCAVPCYNVACGLAGGNPDPPGTYKPCIFTRVKLEHPEATSVLIEMTNSANEAVYSATRPLTASPNEHLWFETIPLYRTAGVFLPLGAYQLKATVKSEAGETLNTSTAALRIE